MIQERTPEQQRNDMFKIMNEANKDREVYDPVIEECNRVKKNKINFIVRRKNKCNIIIYNNMTAESQSDLIHSIGKQLNLKFEPTWSSSNPKFDCCTYECEDFEVEIVNFK